MAGKSVAAQYFGCFVIAMGLYMCGGVDLVWLPSNLPRFGKRTTSVGMVLMLGSCAGVTAPYVSIIININA